MADQDQEKEEQPTPKRRADARGKGNVIRSQEVVSSSVMLAALGILWLSCPWMFREMIAVLREIFQAMGTYHLVPSSAERLFWMVFRQVLLILSPVFLAVVLAGVAANLVQVGFLITGEPLTPNFSRLDPISGMKRFLSLRSLVELVKSVLKMGLIGAIAMTLLYRSTREIPPLIQTGIGDILGFIGDKSLTIAFYACLAMMFLAALDYAFQRWQYEKDLRMSKQEVKDEYKQQEGDPQIKARIRSMRMEMARRRMMTAVPHADVVITNPTHLAVALAYEAGKMPAPRLVAKGRGLIADRIREIAKEHRIPVVEDKPLARTIYKTVSIGDIIPPDLYKAVAEILAYVYRLRGRVVRKTA